MKNKKVILGLELSDVSAPKEKKHVVSKYRDETFRKSVSVLVARLGKFYGLTGQKPFFVFQNERISTGDALALFSTGDATRFVDVRIVLSEADIPAANLNVDNKALFVVVGGSPARYSQSGFQPRNFRVDMRAAYAHLFVVDYFCELYFANCAYPIKNFLASSGSTLEKLYELKNMFTSRCAQKMPDRFGMDRAEIDYTCIFHASRETTSVVDFDALRSGVGFWDRLILDPMAGLCPTKQQTLDAIANWPKVGGSLNLRKISALYDRLPPGAHLLTVQKRSTSVRQSEVNHLRMRGLIGTGLSKKAKLSKAVAFIRGDSSNAELDWAIDSNFAQVFRIWKS